jgi:hypothetical protein
LLLLQLHSANRLQLRPKLYKQRPREEATATTAATGLQNSVVASFTDQEYTRNLYSCQSKLFRSSFRDLPTLFMSSLFTSLQNLSYTAHGYLATEIYSYTF